MERPPMHCHRCDADIRHDGNVKLCAACARDIKADVGRELLADLGQYWSRRLLEARERDWT